MLEKIKAKLGIKAKPKLYDEKYKIVPAFISGGVQYWMFEDPLNITTGRGLTSMVYYEEMLMRCNRDFLNTYLNATDKILTDPKKIDIKKLIHLNILLRERVELLYAVPDHVWKLAAVVFFDDTESPFQIDHAYASKKIKSWQEAGDVKDFFYSTPLKVLVPFLDFPEGGTERYSMVLERVSEKTKSILQPLISEDLLKVNF